MNMTRSPAAKRDTCLLTCLEQLDRIPGWIIQKNLRSAWSFQNLAPKMQVRSAKPVDLVWQIVDVDDDAIPAARLRVSPVRHRFGRSTNQPSFITGRQTVIQNDQPFLILA